MTCIQLCIFLALYSKKIIMLECLFMISKTLLGPKKQDTIQQGLTKRFMIDFDVFINKCKRGVLPVEQIPTPNHNWVELLPSSDNYWWTKSILRSNSIAVPTVRQFNSENFEAHFALGNERPLHSCCPFLKSYVFVDHCKIVALFPFF